MAILVAGHSLAVNYRDQRVGKTFLSFIRLLLDRCRVFNSQPYPRRTGPFPCWRYPLDIGLLGNRATR